MEGCFTRIFKKKKLYLILEIKNMKIEKTKLDGVLIIMPKVFIDCRGFFIGSYNKKMG